jgi:predicted amidohydrolase
MKISLLQWDTVWEDPQANFNVVKRLLDNACAQDRPDLVCLPELFATGFTMNVEELAEPPQGPTYQFLSKIADQYDIYLQGSAIRQAGKRGQNMAYIFSPDGNEIAQYAKIHPFSFADEDQYYEPGQDVVTVDILGFTICPVICYDLRFPSMFQKAVQKGADVFLIPANWPSPRLDHWQTLLRARAIENQSYVAAINRTGHGNDLDYPGHSTLIDPWGKTIEELQDEEGCLTEQVTKSRLNEIRSSYPFLQDMRFDIQ